MGSSPLIGWMWLAIQPIRAQLVLITSGRLPPSILSPCLQGGERQEFRTRLQQQKVKGQTCWLPEPEAEFPGDKNGSPVPEGSARAGRSPETLSRTVFRLLHTDGLNAKSPET